MKNKLVVLPDTIKTPISECPGFLKKGLAGFHAELAALCGFGCVYCSSNTGNYLRINRRRFADETERQLGERLYPATDPALMIKWQDILSQLDRQLASKPGTWGRGHTLVLSMLTDAFSPLLVTDGTTRAALDMILSRTSFRVRVLTKNAIVGSSEWVSYFQAHPGRFIVGLSVGTVDDDWAKKVEVGTSTPSARLRAMTALQDAGVPTFGMLCPIFPAALGDGRVEELVERLRPALVEDLWAEPYNDRINWRLLRERFPEGSDDYQWFTAAFERKGSGVWSAYATELYQRLAAVARRDGWSSKLHYLLYEKGISAEDAPQFRGFEGVMLQGKPGEEGLSANPHVAQLQRAANVPSPAPANVVSMGRFLESQNEQLRERCDALRSEGRRLNRLLVRTWLARGRPYETNAIILEAISSLVGDDEAKGT